MEDRLLSFVLFVAATVGGTAGWFIHADFVETNTVMACRGEGGNPVTFRSTTEAGRKVKMHACLIYEDGRGNLNEEE